MARVEERQEEGVEEMREAREVGGQRLRYAEAAAWGQETFRTIQSFSLSFLNLIIYKFPGLMTSHYKPPVSWRPAW